MAGLSIIGSGHFVPGRPYTNHDLAKVLDTNDEWIRQRTGIGQRHFAAPDQGPSHLALPAAQRALESAGLTPQDLDYVLFNTMTPDYLLPGSGPILASKLGCSHIPARRVTSSTKSSIGCRPPDGSSYPRATTRKRS